MASYALMGGPLPVQKGSATAGGGTFVATLITNALAVQNTLARVLVEVYLSESEGGGVLTNAAAYLCECVILNKAGTVTFPTAIATSSNPVNSATVGFELTHRPEASDAAFATATVVLTIDASGNLLCTVTNNNGAGIAADVTVIAKQSFLSVASGVLVREWLDQSGAGDANRDMTQPAIANRPTLIGSDPLLNGQSSVLFTRTVSTSTRTRLLQRGVPSDSPIVQPYTIIIVGYDDAATVQQPWMGNSATNDWYMSSFNSMSSPPPVFGSSIGPVIAFANLGTLLGDTGQSIIFMSEFNDPSSSTIRVNSYAPLSTQDNGSIGAPGFTNGGNLPDILSMAYTPGTGQNWNGACAEAMVFGGLLSTPDLQGLLNYLQTRYALAVTGLPSVSPILPTAIGSAPLQCWFRADLGIVA